MSEWIPTPSKMGDVVRGPLSVMLIFQSLSQKDTGSCLSYFIDHIHSKIFFFNLKIKSLVKDSKLISDTD